MTLSRGVMQEQSRISMHGEGIVVGRNLVYAREVTYSILHKGINVTQVAESVCAILLMDSMEWRMLKNWKEIISQFSCQQADAKLKRARTISSLVSKLTVGKCLTT
jgi:hypothetical protein